MTIKIIDPHIHLFDLEKGHYDWLKPTSPPLWPDKEKLNHNFDESDLGLGQGLELAGFVHIEAGFDNYEPWREIEFLEATCKLPFRSVACIDLTSEKFDEHIARLVRFDSVVGVRHILDDRAAALLSNELVKQRLATIAQHGLIFEAQIALCDEAGVDSLCELLEQLPSLNVVLNHAGFPPYTGNQQADLIWLRSLKKLALFPKVHIKLSGWEMTNRSWQPEWAAQVLVDAVNIMGHNNVMFASNFPLCTLSLPYLDYWQLVCQLMTSDPASLTQMPTQEERLNLFNNLVCKNAYKIYRIK